MKKSSQEFFQCDCCGICIGPGFLNSIPDIIGPSTICSRCHGLLKKGGFLILTEVERINAYKVMRTDGMIFLVEKRKMNRLKNKIREEIIKALSKF